MSLINGCRGWARALAVCVAGAAAAVAAPPAEAFFEQVDTSAFYVAGTGSYTIMRDFRVNRVEGEETVGSTRLFMDDGMGFTAALGYDASPFRIELEGSYRSNDVDRIDSGPPLPSYADARGDINYRSVMGNVYYDAEV